MRALKRKSLLSMLMVLAFVITGCASDPKKEGQGDSVIEAPTDTAVNLELNGSSDDNTAGPLKTIYFDFDSSQLSSAAKQTLEENATWMKLTDKVDVQIEGHADERGGVQYNLALGERRAKAVKDYLEALGVNAARIEVISIGKERPNAFGHDEESWAKNRRANFVITAK